MDEFPCHMPHARRLRQRFLGVDAVGHDLPVDGMLMAAYRAQSVLAYSTALSR
jgi:hypothetical protein